MISKIRFLLHISFVMIVLFFVKGCRKEDNGNNIPIDTVTDIDGNVYHFDTIGTQIWMIENLKVTHYRNGDSIPHITSNNVWKHLRSDAYSMYKNNDSIGNIYGLMYTWYAANDSCKICPEGWHIPSYPEWLILENYLGGELIAGGKMKETGVEHWPINYLATNESGFTALPGGYRSQWTGGFTDLGLRSFWWSTTELDSIWAPYCGVFWSDGYFHRDRELKNTGFNLRCVKD